MSDHLIMTATAFEEDLKATDSQKDVWSSREGAGGWGGGGVSMLSDYLMIVRLPLEKTSKALKHKDEWSTQKGAGGGGVGGRGAGGNKIRLCSQIT